MRALRANEVVQATCARRRRAFGRKLPTHRGASRVAERGTSEDETGPLARTRGVGRHDYREATGSARRILRAAGEPARTSGEESVQLGTKEAGHVALDLVAKPGLHVGQVPVPVRK
jgi:hypothetical protein